MLLKTNQKGFSAIEGILLLVIVSIIGGVGFYVYDANNGADTSSQQTQTTSQAKKPEVAKDYLVVKELGIKFDKSTIPTAYYKIGESDSNYPEVKKIYLYDSAYDNTLNSKGVKCKDADTLDVSVAGMYIIPASIRDSKYSQYTNASLGVNDTVPTVLSNKYNKPLGDYLSLFYKQQGVQAGLSCIMSVWKSGSDSVEKVNSENIKVQSQYDESYKKLEKMAGTLEKN